jgi:phosphoribosylformylglycinamidine cyclo-ligase
LPVFDVMQNIGKIEQDEMYRAFNMGIGMVFIVKKEDVNRVKDSLKDISMVYEIGNIDTDSNGVDIS